MSGLQAAAWSLNKSRDKNRKWLRGQLLLRRLVWTLQWQQFHYNWEAIPRRGRRAAKMVFLDVDVWLGYVGHCGAPQLATSLWCVGWFKLPTAGIFEPKMPRFTDSLYFIHWLSKLFIFFLNPYIWPSFTDAITGIYTNIFLLFKIKKAHRLSAVCVTFSCGSTEARLQWFSKVSSSQR